MQDRVAISFIRVVGCSEEMHHHRYKRGEIFSAAAAASSLMAKMAAAARARIYMADILMMGLFIV